MAIYDVQAEELIKRVAQKLEEEEVVQPAEWAHFVRTGASRDRRPTQENWWHIRSASILRKIFMKGPIGVSKLRVEYGGRKNKGVQPEEFYPASGNIIRKILQQLEKSGLAKQADREGYKGRVVTPKGHALLESISAEIMKEKGIELKEKPKTELPKKKTGKKTAKKKTTKKKAAKKTVKKEAEEKAEKKTTEKPAEEAAKEEKPAEKKAEEKPAAEEK